MNLHCRSLLSYFFKVLKRNFFLALVISVIVIMIISIIGGKRSRVVASPAWVPPVSLHSIIIAFASGLWARSRSNRFHSFPFFLPQRIFRRWEWIVEEEVLHKSRVQILTSFQQSHQQCIYYTHTPTSLCSCSIFSSISNWNDNDNNNNAQDAVFKIIKISIPLSLVMNETRRRICMYRKSSFKAWIMEKKLWKLKLPGVKEHIYATLTSPIQCKLL